MIGPKISKLQVTNFRNLSTDVFNFTNGINCILGDNGNGKTNILEAIYILAFKKSFRKNAGFPQYLSIDGEKPEILFSSVFLDEEDEQHSYTGKWEISGNNWFLNGRPVKRRPPINIVFINPFDSYAFHTTASFRRSWFDQHIGLISEDYKKALNKYTKALRFRNNLLSKKPNKFIEQIKIIDREIANLSVFITNERLEFIQLLNPHSNAIFKKVFSEDHELNVELESKFIGLNSSQVYDLLQSKLEKEVMACHSLIGIHKDDYVLLFDNLNSYDFCSLGQQKMSYLGLIFAYIELFRYKFNTFPMVLIDDISGELDGLRWKNLIRYLEISKFQVLITTANEKFKEELEKIDTANKVYIDSGSLIQ